jgi:hypothetical protein
MVFHGGMDRQIFQGILVFHKEYIVAIASLSLSRARRCLQG